MRVLVCGSRTFEDSLTLSHDADTNIVEIFLEGVRQFAECHNNDAEEAMVLIQGGAPGADLAAKHWYGNGPTAYCGCEVQMEEYLADWAKHGKAAGPMRNELMLANAQPIDLVLAFVDKPLVESKGTYDMVRRAKRCHIPTYVVQRA